jgi:hypothetical protein
MRRNDARDFADLLYARIPSQYRVFDDERGRPLYALVTVIAEQVSNVRVNLDRLWDDFFIETCDDWVVPYLGALVGTNLVQHPVGRGNRLEVRDTVRWRRSRGTLAMLREVVSATSEWPCEAAEFFQHIGWSQNMNHRRLDHPLTPDLRAPYPLSLLGRANDPLAHAADIRPARDLEQPRLARGGLTTPGVPGWGTPGRHQIRKLGFFVRRLQTFELHGVTPAGALPGATPALAGAFTFDPLFRDAPLFEEDSAAPITRAAFEHDPWRTFGRDLTVRQYGVPLATDAAPRAQVTASHVAFTFGGRSNVSLRAVTGLRLLQAQRFELGGSHFLITAEWHDGTTGVPMGALSTLYAAAGRPETYQAGSAASGAHQLAISVQTGGANAAWPTSIALPESSAARFPGAVIVVSAVPDGALRSTDALHVYLPPLFLAPGGKTTLFVASDGSTYTAASLDAPQLARASEGEVFPARALTFGTTPAAAFTRLDRKGKGIVIPDPTRLANVEAAYIVNIFTGVMQPIGGIATTQQPAASYPELDAPNPWPAFTYAPRRDPDPTGEALLAVRVRLLSGTRMPPTEIVLRNRRGDGLLVYLPELDNPPTAGVDFFVADDGSTHFVPPDQAGQQSVLDAGTLSGLVLARASAGQALPIPGLWPLSQRLPVAANLCAFERRSLLHGGELGIDPELGRWAVPSDDPCISGGDFSVDYVEAFAGPVGARTFDRLPADAAPASRFVTRTGDFDTDKPVHATIAAAVAAAADGDVIELADSATYAETAEIAVTKRLVIRAAEGERPCLTFYSGGAPLSASFRIPRPIDAFECNGLLVSGGPIMIDEAVGAVSIVGCTLDPRFPQIDSIVAAEASALPGVWILVCRCITGGLRFGAVPRITIADSIVDRQGALAIAGLPIDASELANPPLAAAAGGLQLERVTVMGMVRCDTLSASETILDERAFVDDQQSGCIRYSRYELGSVLPRRFVCVPDEQTLRATPPYRRAAGPVFNSRRFGRPDYAQLAFTSAAEIDAASEERSEIGAFARVRNPIRLANVRTKLREFMPVGLTALVIAET